MDNKLAYFTPFAISALKSCFCNQKLVIPPVPENENDNTLKGDMYCRKRNFKISASYRREWIELMRVTENAEYVPFSYHWPWLIDSLVTDLLPGLNLNLKNYLHVGQKIEYVGDYSDDPDARYTLALHLLDLCPVGGKAMAIVTDATVCSVQGETVLKAIDYSFVRNMARGEMKILSSLPYVNNHDISILRNGFTKTLPRFDNGSNRYSYTGKFYIDEKMGIRYGFVSGAMNTAHTFKTLSPMFGHPKPFLQGMCTGNIIMSLIGTKIAKKMKSIEMYFNRKIFNPQEVELRFDGTHFELFNEDNVMVAFGKCIFSS